MFFLLKSYFDWNFEVTKNADSSRYANGNDIRLINLGPTALFSNFNSSKSSGNHLEDVSHAHIVSLMYKLVTSAEGTDDLSIGSDRDSRRRQQDLTNYKNIKGKFLLRIMLKDVFELSDNQ